MAAVVKCLSVCFVVVVSSISLPWDSDRVGQHDH